LFTSKRKKFAKRNPQTPEIIIVTLDNIKKTTARISVPEFIIFMPIILITSVMYIDILVFESIIVEIIIDDRYDNINIIVEISHLTKNDGYEQTLV
jgi:hypothetical protein